MIANYQYLFTCIAFSIGAPFRREWWTNRPFLICCILIFMIDTLVLFLPDGNAFTGFFNMLAFTDKDGHSYYSYRYNIAIGILVNTALTYFFERAIALNFTRRWDAKQREKKVLEFANQMDQYEQQHRKYGN